MRKTIGLALIVVLGCGKSGGDGSAPAPTAPSEPAPPGAKANANPEAKPDDPTAVPEQNVKLDPSKAKAFVSYQEKYLAISADVAKVVAAITGKATPGSVALTKNATAQDLHLNEQLSAARKEFALSDEDVLSLSSIQSAVLMRNSPLAKQMAEQVAALEKQMPSIPPQMRAEAEQSLKDMKAKLAAIESMRDARDKYGDAIVDAMLAQAPALESQFERLAKPQ